MHKNFPSHAPQKYDKLLKVNILSLIPTVGKIHLHLYINISFHIVNIFVLSSIDSTF